MENSNAINNDYEWQLQLLRYCLVCHSFDTIYFGKQKLLPKYSALSGATLRFINMIMCVCEL